MTRERLGHLVLASWALLFWILIATDRVVLYLSPRTAWVVPVGAVVLTIAFVGAVARSGRVFNPADRSEVVGAATMILPVVLILATPAASLGSYAVERRSTIASGGFATQISDIETGDLDQMDVAGALTSPEAMAALAERAGEEVTFTGFVTHEPDDASDGFTLNRFVISCCVADALNAAVAVVGAPPANYPEDRWVEVTGDIYPLENKVVLDATEVRTIERPKQPYLSP